MRLETRDGPDGVTAAFLDLPHAVYRDDPRWIPEEREAVARAFSSGNAWFARGSAITLCAPGAARLALFVDPTCTIDGERAAYFGYWEQRGPAASSAALFDEAARWAAERGCTMLYGPIDFTTFGRYRLSSGVEVGGLPFPGEPYQPASYAAALASMGFVEARRYATQVGATPRAAVEHKRAALVAATAAGYSFEPLDERSWLEFVPELHAAADAIFGDGFAYTPVSREQFAAGYGASVARRLCPRTSLVARDARGALAGFLLAFPHYGALVVQAAGAARVPEPELSFTEHAPRLRAAGDRTAIVKTVGVTPEHRRRGVLDAMSVLAVERSAHLYDRWMAALVRQDNPSGRFAAPHAETERTYTLHALRIAPGGADA